MTDHNPALAAQIDEFERVRLPQLIAEYDEGDVLNAFAGEADMIVAQAQLADRPWARGRMDCMLKNAGLIPGEEEGEPCT